MDNALEPKPGLSAVDCAELPQPAHATSQEPGWLRKQMTLLRGRGTIIMLAALSFVTFAGLLLLPASSASSSANQSPLCCAFDAGVLAGCSGGVPCTESQGAGLLRFQERPVENSNQPTRTSITLDFQGCF